jgi:hypothetical protein
MTIRNRLERFMSVYNRWLGLVLWTVMAAILTVCCIVVAAEAHTNRVQDAQRLADQRQRTAVIAHVTSCIRDFAAELGDNLPPVRTASAVRDSKLRAAMANLEVVLTRTVEEKVTAADVRGLVAALQEYQDASHHLNTVRDANPYPKIPASACQVDDR